MQTTIALRLSPREASEDASIKAAAASTLSIPGNQVTGYHILKKSIDARGKSIFVNLSINAFINEPFLQRERQHFNFKKLPDKAKRIIIIGAGPAGLFAALQLLELGIQPILLERGKDIRTRRRDLAILNKEGIVNPESNYCFGEGGAGTYSDGKLYTRSNKRGNINRILNLFVHFGADETILSDAHPHIGTNKLPQIIAAMRNLLLDCGAECLFEKKVTDFLTDRDKIKAVVCSDGSTYTADGFILATGHSARDVFELLHRKKLLVEAKPFALGVRIEHPQAVIDQAQYHCSTRGIYLPPAAYSLVQQVEGRGVFSFCMCPGGIIAAAATAPGEIVVNGWSPSKRNNPFANSGMVVQVTLAEAIAVLKQHAPGEIIDSDHPLLLLRFQQLVEQQCYAAGGGQLKAPAQRMVDFATKKSSASLPGCSYQPGLSPVLLNEVLPGFIYSALAKGFLSFGKKMKGFYTNDATVVATESRTSSPVRIPRDPVTLLHPQLSNLYPCGEGAGYAGGIVSAAMDGERIAKQIAAVFNIQSN